MSAADDPGSRNDPEDPRPRLSWADRHNRHRPAADQPSQDPADQLPAAVQLELDCPACRAYVDSAVADEIATMRAATPDSHIRNHTLNRCAFALGQLVGAGVLDRSHATTALTTAATAVGLPTTEIRNTLRSGLGAGLQQPRDLAAVHAGHRHLNGTVTEVDSAKINGDRGMSEATNDPHDRYRFTPGGSFILDIPPEPPAVWGRNDQVLLADGEALIIAGPQGVGKTTLGQQLALGRAGFLEYANLLGHAVVPGRQRVLYLAMDRPRQAARSFRRMVGEAWRNQLDRQLVVWPGPPPVDLAKHPATLRRLAEDADADTVVIDSIKDGAIPISDDEVGAGWNRAIQGTLVAGVQVIELHHLRKLTRPVDKITLEDLYGSTWITAGAGSVVLLAGQPGDPIVTMRHLKQPSAEVGPLKIIHDHNTGQSTIWHQADLLALAGTSDGVTANQAARALFDTDKPSPAEREKARRRLEQLVRDGRLRVTVEGNKTTNTAQRWGKS